MREAVATEELSLGDFVLTGGEVAALAVIEATVRLLPGALGDEGSAEEDSFADGLLDYPALHPSRRRCAAGPCPRSCSPATTAGCGAGGRSRPCGRPASAGPTCSRRARLTAEDESALARGSSDEELADADVETAVIQR